MIDKALILAAGKGTRMWPLTDNTPKPLLPLGGIPIIKRQIDELKKVGVENVYVLIGYQMKEISDFLGSGKEHGVKIEYIVQAEQKGTGHAILQAEGKINGKFYCINGDTTIDRKNLEQMRGNTNNACMMVTKVNDASRFGVVNSKNGKLISIIEKGMSGEAMINAGQYVFSEKIFGSIKKVEKSERSEYEITDALQAISENVGVIEYEGFWKDIGSPWDLITANESIISDIDEEVKGQIEDDVTVNGKVYVGKNSVIKSGSYIEGNVWIGDDCVVGPNAYLRNGTVLCGENKVGASSEIKNSIMMYKAKAPHHNYVGDSIVGRNSNLGSGTKIANLRLDKKNIEVIHQGKKIDSGRRKFGAIIGDNVNTGINASINTGTILGNNVSIGPNTLVSGTYESNSIVV